MEHNGESRKLLLDLSEDVECQGRRNEYTIHECALLRSELVSTVRSTDRDSQRVATSTGSEVDDLLRLGVVRLSRADLILNTSEHTQLSLNSYIELMSIINELLSQSNVLLVGEVRTVDHH